MKQIKLLFMLMLISSSAFAMGSNRCLTRDTEAFNYCRLQYLNNHPDTPIVGGAPYIKLPSPEINTCTAKYRKDHPKC